MSKKDKQKKREKVKIETFTVPYQARVVEQATSELWPHNERLSLGAASEAATEIARLADLVDELQAENTALRSENDYLSTQANDHRETVAFRNRQLTNIRQENFDLKAQLELANSEIERVEADGDREIERLKSEQFVRSFVQKDQQPQYVESGEAGYNDRLQMAQLKEENEGLRRQIVILEDDVEDREKVGFTADHILAVAFAAKEWLA